MGRRLRYPYNSDITVRNVVGTGLTFADATFSGNVTIGGTLTYDDVTNIDAIGVITARSGIVVTGTVSATTFDGAGTSLTGVSTNFVTAVGISLVVLSLVQVSLS